MVFAEFNELVHFCAINLAFLDGANILHIDKAARYGLTIFLHKLYYAFTRIPGFFLSQVMTS